MRPEAIRLLTALGLAALAHATSGCATLLDIEEASCAEGLPGCSPANNLDAASPTGGEDSGTEDSRTRDSGTKDPGVDLEAKREALCATYCGELDKSCSVPELLQYADGTCEDICLEYLLTADEVSTAGASSANNNTIECRIREARSAASESLACAVAGLSGDNECGDVCEVYCELVEARCKPQYIDTFDEDSETCEEECQKLPRSDVPFNVSIQEGNTLECRFYHLQAAARGGSDRHCDHAVGEAFCVE